MFFVFRCFLNPGTKFVWAFIAPVIVIFLLNIGFLVMAAIVMLNHKRKKRGELNRKDIKNWLKTLASLVVIMGLTWIIGIAIVEVKELLPLAYIYTIMVAFQGLWIFLTFVVAPKQVRDEFVKAWKSNVKHSCSKYFSNSSSTAVTMVSVDWQVPTL